MVVDELAADARRLREADDREPVDAFAAGDRGRRVEQLSARVLSRVRTRAVVRRRRAGAGFPPRSGRLGGIGSILDLRQRFTHRTEHIYNMSRSVLACLRQRRRRRG